LRRAIKDTPAAHKAAAAAAAAATKVRHGGLLNLQRVMLARCLRCFKLLVCFVQ
jgi:hypothetical protein